MPPSGPRWDTGGGGGSGSADRPDPGESNGPDVDYSDRDDDGVAEHDDGGGGSDHSYTNPDHQQGYDSPDSGSSGGGSGGGPVTGGTDFHGHFGGVPFREGGPFDPDVGTPHEDDDSTGGGAVGPIDNPGLYGHDSAASYLAQNYPESEALANLAASLGRDPESFAPSSGPDDTVNTGEGGGGVTNDDGAVNVDDGSPGGTNVPNEGGDDFHATDPEEEEAQNAAESGREAADAATSWLEENQGWLGPVGTVVTVGSLAYTIIVQD